jgi:hypothetical protein
MSEISASHGDTKMAVFWVVAPCSLVEYYRRFKDVCCVHYQVLIALMMEVAGTAETSVNFYRTTRRNEAEDSHLNLLLGCCTVLQLIMEAASMSVKFYQTILLNIPEDIHLHIRLL